VPVNPAATSKVGRLLQIMMNLLDIMFPSSPRAAPGSLVARFAPVRAAPVPSISSGPTVRWEATCSTASMHAVVGRTTLMQQSRGPSRDRVCKQPVVETVALHGGNVNTSRKNCKRRQGFPLVVPLFLQQPFANMQREGSRGRIIRFTICGGATRVTAAAYAETALTGATAVAPLRRTRPHLGGRVSPHRAHLAPTPSTEPDDLSRSRSSCRRRAWPVLGRLGPVLSSDL
jgi:hypothetical protein